MGENRLHEIKKLQGEVHRWFWSSCPWGIGVLVEMVRVVPGVAYNVLEGKNVSYPELTPALIFFVSWWVQYEIAEHKLLDMERRNFAYSNDRGHGIRYGFPERFIEKINLMRIKLR